MMTRAPTATTFKCWHYGQRRKRSGSNVLTKSKAQQAFILHHWAIVTTKHQAELFWRNSVNQILATFTFIDNVARAIKYTGLVILDLIPKIYDSARVVITDYGCRW